MNRATPSPSPSPAPVDSWDVKILTADGQLVEVVKTGIPFSEAQTRAERINEIAERHALGKELGAFIHFDPMRRGFI